MKNLFIPYEVAVKLKEKGFFDDGFESESLGFYAEYHDKSKILAWGNYEWDTCGHTEAWHQLEQDAPIYQQVIDWFEKFNIYIHTTIEILGSDEFEHGYAIDFIPQEFHEAKRRCPYFQTIKSYKEGIGSYMGAWHTKTEAISAAIEEALNLI